MAMAAITAIPVAGTMKTAALPAQAVQPAVFAAAPGRTFSLPAELLSGWQPLLDAIRAGGAPQQTERRQSNGQEAAAPRTEAEPNTTGYRPPTLAAIKTVQRAPAQAGKQTANRAGDVPAEPKHSQPAKAAHTAGATESRPPASAPTVTNPSQAMAPVIASEPTEPTLANQPPEAAVGVIAPTAATADLATASAKPPIAAKTDLRTAASACTPPVADTNRLAAGGGASSVPGKTVSVQRPFTREVAEKYPQRGIPISEAAVSSPAAPTLAPPLDSETPQAAPASAGATTFVATGDDRPDPNRSEWGLQQPTETEAAVLPEDTILPTASVAWPAQNAVFSAPETVGSVGYRTLPEATLVLPGATAASFEAMPALPEATTVLPGTTAALPKTNPASVTAKPPSRMAAVPLPGDTERTAATEYATQKFPSHAPTKTTRDSSFQRLDSEPSSAPQGETINGAQRGGGRPPSETPRRSETAPLAAEEPQIKANSAGIAATAAVTHGAAETSARGTAVHRETLSTAFAAPGAVSSGIQAHTPVAEATGTGLLQGATPSEKAAPSVSATRSVGDSAPAAADSIATLDAGGAKPVTIHASSRQVEAGFQDPALGWVGVHAEVGSSGGIHASVVPDSSSAAQVLSTHMSGLQTYLAERHTAVETLTMAAPGDNQDRSLGQSGGQGQDRTGGEMQDAQAGVDGAALRAFGENETAPASDSLAAAEDGHISVLA